MRLAFSTETNHRAALTARLGVVLLQTDAVTEREFPRLLDAENVRVHYSRIPSAREVSPEGLAAMEAALPAAVELLPPSVDFDVIAFACTSGATIIGEARVAEAIRSVRPGVAVSNPLTAAKAALGTLGLGRIGFVTPYAAAVSAAMRDHLAAAGFETVSFGSFEVTDDGVVAAMTPDSILTAAIQVGATNDCDGVFIACTNLRAAGIIEAAEAALGKPVISSNQALAWHMLRLAGVDEPRRNCGQLLTLPLG
ncbi:MAG: aspartate/glutamate racemase family protein [Kiloniellaceae bacterium]